jgi:hypothetical protein
MMVRYHAAPEDAVHDVRGVTDVRNEIRGSLLQTGGGMHRIFF